jgi:O-antigen ligase
LGLFPLSARPAPAAARPNAVPLYVLAGALLAVVAFGAVLVHSTKLGVVILLGMCFVPLTLWRLPLAICAWTVLAFLSSTPSVGEYSNRTLLFIGLGWIGLLVGRRTSTRGAIAASHRFLALVAVFLAWTLLSLAWAPAAGAVGTQVKLLLYGCFSLLLLVGAIVERRHVRWLMLAFVAGGTLSVLWGAAKGGLGASGGVATEVVDAAGRFQGGAGDPNYLAAVLVPAIILAGGLAVSRKQGQRALLAIATVILAIGFAATQSRGGLLAASVCALVALVIWRERRALIAGVIGLAGAVTATYFLMKPSAWTRILESNQGSGRIDIWTIASRIVHAHPLFGVGFGQFPQVSVHYVLQPGMLEYIGLVVETHIVVHNLYLALWVEGGIVGLLLFIGVIVGSLRCGWRAMKRFDALGDAEMASLARAAILALVGLLVASFFLSDIESAQLWILLALGPILAGIAMRQARATGSVHAPTSGRSRS